MKDSFDVIVIGAGPAGTTCAKILSEYDFSVLILDHKRFPRVKTCGGALTPRVISRFPFIERFVNMPIFQGFLHSPDFSASSSIQTTHPLGYMIRRVEFDQELVKLAQTRGATFLDGVNVMNIQRQPDKVFVETSEGKFTGDVLVGADGVNGIVAKHCGLNPRWRTRDLGIALVSEISYDKDLLDSFYNPRPVHVHLGGGGAWGYAWMFVKREHVNVGIGIQLTDKIKYRLDMKSYLQEYISVLMNKGFLPRCSSYKIQGALVPLNKPLNKTFDDRILLIGDAAGFVNSLSGEGIYHAMVSGELAARTLHLLKQQGLAFDSNHLRLYQQAWQNDFGAELSKIRFLKRFARIFSQKLVKFAEKDEKWKEIIFHSMLGIDSISVKKMAFHFIKCILKNLF
ncbi:MAG: geranylgeranyl reductase family protein [Candidatus Helarchaeota archaeon]